MIPWILLAIVSVLLLVSVWYNYKFAKIILKIEDSITESLDHLDMRYQSISKILDIPLFSDSPQIRSVVDDMRSCRDTILKAAANIANLEEEITDGKEEKN